VSFWVSNKILLLHYLKTAVHHIQENPSLLFR